ncbi:MAG: hypothetical protein HY222_07400 [Thaumarchaeota archaeon]|nr:hypothetical protein [Nitrososphaerota archaeon]MBI3642200.1 hypothetical protein [Nitrososphaerota archaeon]
MASEGNVNEGDLAAAVKAMEDLVDEAVQVYEIDKEKTNVIDDLYNSLKIITSYLGFSVDLHPGLLNLPEHTRAILTSSLDILIIKPNFKSEQKRFDQLTLDETSNVLRYAIPTVINMARSDRMIKSKKISFLREGTKKLKRLPSSSVEDMIITDSSVQVEKV